MKTLLHICCAPCANQPIEVLRRDGFDVTGFWYNPNIHPFTEYRVRRNCLREYAQQIELPLIERNDYGLRPFVRAVAEDLPGRCVKCYEMRLFEAARQAAEGVPRLGPPVQAGEEVDLSAEDTAHTVGSSSTRSAPPSRASLARVHLSSTAGRPPWTQLPLITATTAHSPPRDWRVRAIW